MANDSTSVLDKINYSNDPLIIGRRSAEAQSFWNGTIDEFQIWNRVLSPEEINASYQAGTYRLENNFTGLSDGEYNYTAYVIDAAGNTNQTEERFVTIETVAPTINVFSPVNQTYATSTIYFNATASETIDTWIVHYNGTNVTVTINSNLEFE